MKGLSVQNLLASDDDNTLIIFVNLLSCKIIDVCIFHLFGTEAVKRARAAHYHYLLFTAGKRCFFRGLTEQGAPYTVKCGWVAGATTVKYK